MKPLLTFITLFALASCGSCPVEDIGEDEAESNYLWFQQHYFDAPLTRALNTP